MENSRICATVVAPVPWFPFSHPRFGQYAKFACVPKHNTRYDIKVHHPRYPVIPRWGMNIAPWLMATFTRKCVQELIGKIDLIDAHYLYPDGVAATMLGKWFNKPVVLTARGSDVNVLPDYPRPKKQIISAVSNAAGVITVSSALKERLVELGAPSEQITVLRNGVDRELFRPLDRSKIRNALDLSGSVILSVGNLIPLKGHDLVIKAIAKLEDCFLLIIGDGPQRQDLEGLVAAHSLSHRVKFLGAVPQTQLVEYYNAADVTVLASAREGMPNVVLESLACATPVVASAVGGIPEIILAPEAGRLLAERTVEDLQMTLADLLANPPDREATRRYSKRFRWDDTIQRLTGLFAQIVRSGSNV